MAHTANREPADPRGETLKAILVAEIRLCREILEATRAAALAAEALDIPGIEAAMARRGRALGELEHLEAEAEGLRGQDFAPPPLLAEHLAALSDLTVRIRQADAEARCAAERAQEEIQRRVRELQRGRRGLAGYRGPTDPTPRFADRKG
ncbi:hypothetical protein [Deferrisoma palaeochoriense]